MTSLSEAAPRGLAVLQITDCHLLARSGTRLFGVDTEDSLRAVMAQAFAELTPDAVLVTGDIAHDPQPETYERFAELVAEYFTGPVLSIPGNHDLPAATQNVLADPAELKLGNWRLIGMDTHIDDEVAGRLRATDEARLREACADGGTHLLIACHHPPIELECPWIDRHRIQEGPELLEWLSEHLCVKGIVFGHAHQLVDTSYKQITLMGTPSSCYQFKPRTERFTIDDTMPGYRWLHLAADGGIRTDVRRVQDYPLRIDPSQRA